jgi:hypothetical protein
MTEGLGVRCDGTDRLHQGKKKSGTKNKDHYIMVNQSTVPHFLAGLYL